MNSAPRGVLSNRQGAPAAAPSFLFLHYEVPLGFAAIATATFASLKARRPDARITVAAAGLPANLLRASPLVDELIVTPHAITDFPAAVGFFLSHIRPRRREFDYVLTDLGNQRTKIAMLAMASGARRRVGFAVRPWLHHAGMTFDAARSNIANNLRMLDAAGAPGESQGPAIHYRQADLVKARALLDAAPPGPGPVIAVITQASKGHPNEWFDDRWIALSGRLIERLGARLVFVGTEADRGGVDRIRERIGAPTLSVAGRTDIPELAALLARCDLTVTIDTGGLHVARGVDAPAVVLANAAQPDNWWLPKDEPLYRVLRHGYVPCAGCLKFVCATRECMQESTVDVVEAAVRAQLAAYPPSEQARSGRAAARLS